MRNCRGKEHVLVLGPNLRSLIDPLQDSGCTVDVSHDPLGEVNADWIVSFGYRHIIKEPHLSRFAGRMLNIHISVLPWNRGADPNLWSWYDDTPRGVSIHWIDKGIDTGPLLAQRAVALDPDAHTLRTSHAALVKFAAEFFADVWLKFRCREPVAIPQTGPGSFHRVSDGKPLWAQLPLGYDTPCRDVMTMGARARAKAAAA